MWPPKVWTLDDLTLVALHYHPWLSLARAQWAAARAKAITAGAYPNPTLQFFPQYASNAASLSPWTIGLSIAVPILTTNKRSDRIADALDQAEAARLDVQQAAWQIRADVQRPLIKLYAAQRRISLLDVRTQDASALLEALRLRLKAGQITQFPVIQAQNQWVHAQLSRAAEKTAKNQARVALAGALGVPLSALHKVHFDFNALQHTPSMGKIPEARFKTYALTHRPDIRAALMRYAASEQALKQEVTRQYPNLHIGPGYKWDQGTYKWSIGLSLRLPIFNQNQGPIAQARAQRKQMVAKFRVLHEHITTQFDRALTGYRASEHTLELAELLIKKDQAQLAAARAAYQAGETSWIDLLRIRLETLNDRRVRLRARIQIDQALAALEDTVEHPLQQPTAVTRVIEKIARPTNTPPSAETFSS